MRFFRAVIFDAARNGLDKEGPPKERERVREKIKQTHDTDCHRVCYYVSQNNYLNRLKSFSD